MRQNRPTGVEAIRQRLLKRLDDVDISERELALRTGQDPRNVNRWLTGRVKSIPAEFVAQCEEIGFASARWLLLGQGVPDVGDPDVDPIRLHVMRRVLDEDLSPADLRRLARPLDEIGEERAARARAAIAGLDPEAGSGADVGNGPPNHEPHTGK